MAASGRGDSSASFSSSSLSARPSFGLHSSPVDSTFTPASAAISALTADSSAPYSPPGPLDLGPPGYHATIKLYEQTSSERTVYLGPWEIVDTPVRCIVWQGSYAGEVFEHFLPTDQASDVFPYTQHHRHRRFGDPRDLELEVDFRQPHNIRYTLDGREYEDFVAVKYEFTTVDGSIQFQSELRGRDLIDWFDVDVVWSDRHGRQDGFGRIRGLAAVQRIKLWRDRYSTFHYLTIFANHLNSWREYLVDDFEREIQRDRPYEVRLNARVARRGSASGSTNSHGGRRRLRLFPRSSRTSSQAHHNENAGPSSSAPQTTLDIRFLCIRFTRNNHPQASDDYARFLYRWDAAHDDDSQFEATFPPNYVELPSPHINGMTEATSPYLNGHVNGFDLPSPELVGPTSSDSDTG